MNLTKKDLKIIVECQEIQNSLLHGEGELLGASTLELVGCFDV